MIAVLFTWVVILYVCIILGKTITFCYSSGRTESCYSAIDTFFIGLCISGTLISINSLFLPSGLTTAFALCAIAIICHLILIKKGAISYTQIKQKVKLLSYPQKIWIMIAGICLVLFAMVPPQLPDTFYYHIQNIMWNDEYSVVPGLANLHDRFGFNSNIFLFYAVFGFKAIFGQYIFAFNALCFVLIITDVIFNACNKKILFILSCAIILLFYFSYKLHIGAPSSDLLVNLFIIYLMLQILRDKNSITGKPLLFYTIPIFCITLKVSAAGIAILALIVLIHVCRTKSYKQLSFLLILASCIILPWLTRNIIISGYLIYPFSAIDLFSFDWKLPEQYAIESQKYIKAYAISTDAFKSSDLVLGYPLSIKISKWIAEQSLLNLSICIAASLSILYAIPLIIRKKLYKTDSATFLLWIAALISILVWIFSAPDIRFVVGFMSVLIIIPLYKLVEYYAPNVELQLTKQKIYIIGSVFMFVLLVLSARYYKATKDWREPISKTLYTPDTVDIFYEIREVVIEGQIRVNNLTLYLPIGGCLDCPLPCSRDYIKNIEMRGTSLQEGFREKKN